MSNKSLKLGIITISFNQAKFLTEAIESVQLRDKERLRYVIVDPGSTDGSRDIIESYKDKFSAIITDPDRGPADGLNKGFQACDADIFGYLNADDLFVEGALDFVLEYFERNPHVDAIMGAVKIVDAQGKRDKRSRVPWGFSPQDFLDNSYVVLQQGTFFRRSAWEKSSGFNLDNRTCWDTEHMMDMALAGIKFHKVFKVLGEFRIYPESISGSLQLGTSQSMLEKQKKDEARIEQKIKSHGFSSKSKPLSKIKRLWFRIHPVRRILEWVVR